MHRVQELIRLHRLGTCTRAIARQLGMGRDTVRTYLRRLRAAGLLDGDAAALPELELLGDALRRLAPSRVPPQQASSLESWLPRIRELFLRRAGPQAIFDRLRLEVPDFPGSLSAIKRACVRLRREAGPKAEDVAIPVETLPGEIAQVDFGYAGLVFDPEQGVQRRAWLFVMVLGYSRHQFVDVAFDQKVATWIDLHIRAFQAFGGVPEVIVPDNLKSAVIRCAFSADTAPALNRSYRELARYYDFRIDPTPPRAPRKKGKVESGVKYVKGNFLPTCGARDVLGMRQELVRWVAEIAGNRIHGTTKLRPLEVFEAEERAALKPLPARPYDRVIWKRARLHSDAHAQIDGGFYSAPWRHLHQDLWARCTTSTVALYRDDVLLHSHRRVGRGERSTIETHLPEHRANLRHRSRTYWEAKAAEIGDHTLALVRDIFDSDDVLSHLRSVQAIVNHLTPFPSARAEAACRRARYFGNLTYGAIKGILRSGLDLEPLPGEEKRDWMKSGRHARSGAELAGSHQGGLA